MGEFIFLLSNASMNLFPENRLNDYTTQLAQSRNYIGEHEIGMTEVIYPHSWYNVLNCYVDVWDRSVEKFEYQIPKEHSDPDKYLQGVAEKFIEINNKVADKLGVTDKGFYGEKAGPFHAYEENGQHYLVVEWKTAHATLGWT